MPVSESSSVWRPISRLIRGFERKDNLPSMYQRLLCTWAAIAERLRIIP
jgi:hypothetical protein